MGARPQKRADHGTVDEVVQASKDLIERSSTILAGLNDEGARIRLLLARSSLICIMSELSNRKVVLPHDKTIKRALEVMREEMGRGTKIDVATIEKMVDTVRRISYSEPQLSHSQTGTIPNHDFLP